MKERNIIRWIHLISSGAIGTFVYSPWRNAPMFILSMQILVIPTLTLTGFWMWQGHQLKKIFKSSHSQTQD